MAAEGKTILFSYPGRPPSMSGTKDLTKLTVDEIQIWKWLYNYVGGKQATKATIETKLAPCVGAFDWDLADRHAPLDFSAFFRHLKALQTGQRYALLEWAYATSQGAQVSSNPESLMMSLATSYSQKSGSMRTVPSSQGTFWHCPECFVDNEAHLDYCKNCGRASRVNRVSCNGSLLLSIKDSSNTWSCPLCHVNNPKDSAVCTNCGAGATPRTSASRSEGESR
jgi:hypothetical protein